MGECVENKIPLPTDNIYKFYALFGLLLMVTAIAAIIYTYQTTNALVFNNTITLEELKLKEFPSAVDTKKQAILQRQIDIAIKDRDFFNAALGVFLAIAIWAMWYGFRTWHTVIQPKQDRLLDLQIQKAEQDLKPPPRNPFRGPNK